MRNRVGSQSATLVLWRLVDPLTLWDEPERPDFVRWDAATGRRNHPSGCVPNGIRTRVLALKGPRPGPLDDGDRRGGNQKKKTPPLNARTRWKGVMFLFTPPTPTPARGV